MADELVGSVSSGAGVQGGQSAPEVGAGVSGSGQPGTAGGAGSAGLSGQQAGAAGVSAPSSPGTPSPGAVSGFSAPGATSAPAAAGGIGQTAGQAAPGTLERLRALGLDLGGRFGGDEGAALRHLAEVYRQAQQLAPLAQYGQAYLQNREVVEQAIRARQEQERQQAQQRRKWWELPEWNPRWSEGLYRDEASGEYRVRPGYPPDLVDRAQAYARARQDLEDRFWRDPEGTLGPLVQHLAAQTAQQLVQQHLGGYAEQTFAADWVSANSSWIHARDAQGRLVTDAQGRPALSPWGERFAQYVRQAESWGMPLQGQRDYALGMVQRDYAYHQAQGGQQQQQPQQPVQPQNPAVAAGQQAAQNFLAAAAGGQRQPQPTGSQQPGAPSGAGVSLQERMRRKFQEGGFQLATEVPLGR